MTHSNIDWQPGEQVPDREESVRRHLERQIRRQAVLFGRRAAMRYMARLVELAEAEVDREDFYDLAGARLGLTAVRARRLVEDPVHEVS